jgi:hypothetical protein
VAESANAPIETTLFREPKRKRDMFQIRIKNLNCVKCEEKSKIINDEEYHFHLENGHNSGFITVESPKCQM